MPAKRGRSTSYSARAKRARTTGIMYRGVKALSKRLGARVIRANKVAQRVNNLYRMIETKEITWKLESSWAVGGTKYYCPHNNLLAWNQNPFQVSQGAADNAGAGNAPNRIGDQITVKGFGLTLFMENAMGRAKVFYRVMLVRCAKGDTPDRNTFFKGNCDNKMIDQVNTERYTIMAQKTFNITSDGEQPATSVLVGGETAASDRGGMGTKVIKMWIPGRKFGRGGNIQFENNGYQVKFYDYRVVFLAYDWGGTPQDINNVGLINCMYTKIYFKDA